MEIKNFNVEAVLIQLSGSLDGRPIGLLNFAASMKGKLRRTLSNIVKDLTIQHNTILSEKERFQFIEDETERNSEINDLMGESFNLVGINPIPVSWIDEIETSAFISIEFLTEVGVLFDDTKNA